MSVTPLDLIATSLRKIGAFSPGQELPPENAHEALIELNDMINSWSAISTLIYHTDQVFVDLISGQQDYTLGIGGYIDRPRPMYIDRVSIITNPTGSQPLELALPGRGVLSVQEWQAIPVKNISSALPTCVFLDTNYPLATLSVFPIPGSQAVQLKLYLPTAITEFTSLTTAYDFPAGYRDAIVYSLALRLAPDYGRPIDPGLMLLASNAMLVVTRPNQNRDVMIIDPVLGKRNRPYNWLTDQGG